MGLPFKPKKYPLLGNIKDAEIEFAENKDSFAHPMGMCDDSNALNFEEEGNCELLDEQFSGMH